MSYWDGPIEIKVQRQEKPKRQWLDMGLIRAILFLAFLMAIVQMGHV